MMQESGGGRDATGTGGGPLAPVCWLVAVAAALAASSAGAQDGGVDVVLGVSLASTTLSFDEKLDTDPVFPSYALFGSLSRGRVFGTVSYATSFGSTNVSEEDEIGDANREDLDLTVGYRFGRRWTGFVGYKDGETDIDLFVRDSDIVQDEFYREEGFYLGGSYALTFESAGTLSFTAAYIDFDSDLQFTEGVEGDDDDDEDEPTEFDDLEGNFSSGSDGFSLGISWVMPLSDGFAFRALYKINDYDLNVRDEGLLFEPDQQLRYLEIGLLYAF